MRHYGVKEVMELTGVSRDMLIDYEKRGLLHPLRTGEVANDRRLYRDEDIDELGRIVALRAYDFSLGDIGRILGDEDADIHSILEEQIDVLRRKENHVRNLILFAKFIDITDTELYTGLLQGPTDIDAFADTARASETYRIGIERLQSATEEDIERMVEELSQIGHDLMTLGEADGFRGVERQIDRYLTWWDENIEPMERLGYLGFWAIFEDDPVLPALAEGIGDELTSATIQMSAFYVYMKRLMLEAQGRIEEVAKLADTDVIAAIEAARILARNIFGCLLGNSDAALTEGTRELCTSTLSYMRNILEDGELRGYLDPNGTIKLDDGVLARTQSILELMPVEEDAG